MRTSAHIARLYHRVVSSPPDGDCKLGLSLSGIKRAPQCLRQLLNLSTLTVDDEFEQLLSTLDDHEASCKHLLDVLDNYQCRAHEMLASSLNVASMTKVLFDPYFGTCKEESEHLPCEPFHNAKRYLILMEETKLAMTELFSTIPLTLGKRFGLLFTYFNTIRKNIRKRDMALLDYDKAMDKFDPLSIRKSTGILTIKQAQQFHSLQRQVDQLKMHYDTINNMLKKELPYFFRLVESFVHMLLQFFFYMHLANTYQLNRSLLTLAEPMKFCKEEICDPKFGQKIVSQARPLGDPGLHIVLFHRTHLELLVDASAAITGTVSNYNPYWKYCEALFDYSAQNSEDLDFERGSVIRVLHQDGDWWEGELHGRVGMFPSNYVTMRT